MADRVPVTALESFDVYLTDGRPFTVVAGQPFWSDDPVVSSRKHLFGELKVRTSQAPSHKPEPAARAQETADAGPGSRRAVERGGSSRADKPEKADDKTDRKGEV